MISHLKGLAKCVESFKEEGGCDLIFFTQAVGDRSKTTSAKIEQKLTALPLVNLFWVNLPIFLFLKSPLVNVS